MPSSVDWCPYKVRPQMAPLPLVVCEDPVGRHCLPARRPMPDVASPPSWTPSPQSRGEQCLLFVSPQPVVSCGSGLVGLGQGPVSRPCSAKPRAPGPHCPGSGGGLSLHWTLGPLGTRLPLSEPLLPLQEMGVITVVIAMQCVVNVRGGAHKILRSAQLPTGSSP